MRDGQEMAGPEDNESRKDSQAFINMQINVAVLAEKMSSLDTKFDRLISELSTNYARKDDFLEIKKRLDQTDDKFGWVIKTIIGAVLLGILAMLFRSGVGRP